MCKRIENFFLGDGEEVMFRSAEILSLRPAAHTLILVRL